MAKENKESKENKKGPKFDITITEVKFVKQSGYESSLLEIDISGADINTKIVNGLRRVACNNIPTHAFPAELIKIEENTCVAFNNDMMKLRLSLLPIYDVSTDLFFLHEKYWRRVNYADPDREKHKEEKLIELHINSHNNTNGIKNITTEDIRYYVDGEQKFSYNKFAPFLLIKLRPNDTFKCYMKAALGVGENRIFWNAASNAWFSENKSADDKDKNEVKSYRLSINSTGQMPEYVILIKSCKFLIKKLEDLLNELDRRVKAKEISDEPLVHFVLDGEDHTMGEILSYEFQSRREEIIYSGCAKLDHLIKCVTIKVCSINEKSPIPTMKSCILVLIDKITYIQQQFEKLQ